jgi:hypothetical protein
MDLLVLGIASVLGYKVTQSIDKNQKYYTIRDNTMIHDTLVNAKNENKKIFGKKIFDGIGSDPVSSSFSRFNYPEPQNESRNAGSGMPGQFVERLTLGQVTQERNPVKNTEKNMKKGESRRVNLVDPVAEAAAANRLMYKHSSDLSNRVSATKIYDNGYTPTHKMEPFFPTIGDDLRAKGQGIERLSFQNKPTKSGGIEKTSNMGHNFTSNGRDVNNFIIEQKNTRQGSSKQSAKDYLYGRQLNDKTETRQVSFNLAPSKVTETNYIHKNKKDGYTLPIMTSTNTFSKPSATNYLNMVRQGSAKDYLEKVVLPKSKVTMPDKVHYGGGLVPQRNNLDVKNQVTFKSSTSNTFQGPNGLSQKNRATLSTDKKMNIASGPNRNSIPSQLNSKQEKNSIDRMYGGSNNLIKMQPPSIPLRN